MHFAVWLYKVFGVPAPS